MAQSVASSEPITAAKGTATSVYRQFSDAVQSLQQEGARAEPPPSESIPPQGTYTFYSEIGSSNIHH